jgi:hypothetical protein
VPEEPLGGAGGSVRGSARRSELPLLKRAPRIPDPGQYVDLRTENGAWRKGFRTLSEPWTADTGEVMIRVATEDEYRAAAREGHSAVGMPWSTERLRLTSPRPPWNLSRVSVRWAVGGTQIHIGR